MTAPFLSTTHRPGPRLTSRPALVMFAAVVVVTGGLVAGQAPASAEPVATATVPRTATATNPGTTAADAGATGAGLAGVTAAVRYAGVGFRVPAGWRVYDLSAAPRTCVRFDRHAVYLGTPGASQNCPSRLVGRTEALLVQPTATSSTTAVPTALGHAPDVTAGTDGAGAVAAALTSARITVTASYSDRSALARDIIATAHQVGTLTAPAVSSLAMAAVAAARTTVSPSLATSVTYPTASTATFFRGYGFDTCNAPSAAAMTAWKASPYRAIGIYIGGRNRACGWGNLSASWVRTVAKLGWRLQPIYVGRQPSCTIQKGMDDISSTPAAAKEQGLDAANDAVVQARLLGLVPGSVLYSDIENYTISNVTCSTATMTFLDAWTRRLHALGYGSGVYSSAAGAITDMAKRYASTTWATPDVVWTARWDGLATTDERVLTSDKWANRQRIKQYRGDHAETWGGVRITIDSNYVNASMGSATYRYSIVAGGSVNRRSGPSTSFAKKGSLVPGDVVDIVCQLAYTKVDGDPIWNKLTDGTWVSDRFVSTASAIGFSRPLPGCSFAYQVEGKSLNTRAGPSTSATTRTQLSHGSTVAVVCQTSGTKVGGSKVWDQLKPGSYVSDIFVTAPGRPGYTPTIPRCL